MLPSSLYLQTRNWRWIYSPCFTHQVIRLFCSSSSLQLLCELCISPESQTDSLHEWKRELSALLTFCNLLCMCIAQSDTLSPDPLDECVCSVRWRNIHNRKAVSSRKVLITIFSPHIVFSHILSLFLCERVQHPESVHTRSAFIKVYRAQPACFQSYSIHNLTSNYALPRPGLYL